MVRRQHVIIEYLPPIDVAAMDREARKGLPELVRTQMAETYEKNKALI